MDRDKLIKRIRALMEKTVENGCTEGEALAAAEKAASMLQEHNLTLSDLEVREQPFARAKSVHDDLVGERLWKVADAVAYMVGVRYWTSRAGVVPIQITFFGFKHEVEIADYLLAICKRAMQQEHDRASAANALLSLPRRRRKIIPFLDGMADRLRDRIRDMKPKGTTGTAIVPLHDSLIIAELDRLGIKTDQRKMAGSRDFEGTYFDGMRAGDKVSLNRGVGTGSSMRLR